MQNIALLSTVPKDLTTKRHASTLNKSERRQIVDQLVGIGGRCLNTGRAKHGRADARANCLRGQSSTQRNGGKISVIKGERNNQSLNCLYTSTHLGYGTERIGRDTKSTTDEARGQG